MNQLNSAAISVQNVKKYFREVKAVDGIDLQIQPGEYVGLLGPNGAGKTTLVEMIEGLQQPDAGDILIKGKHWKGSEDELHRTIGISLQETYFIDKLSARETLNLFAGFYGLNKTRVDDILQLVKLQEKQKSYVVNLSGGQRQRLALGIALLNEPEILLLDEPTTGLDPTARRDIWDILFRLKTEKNTTMILTTHYMEEADFLCERIVIMDRGKILAQGNLEELLAANRSSEIIEFSLAENVADFKPPTEPGQQLIWDAKDRNWRLMVNDIVSYLPRFLEALPAQDLTLKSLECRKMTLDDLFIAMTGRRLDD
jgi:ABC-2 type transport system ATP-binding protein